jgi:ribosomal protein S18 acetylase RimI-like enzyme
LSAFPSAAVSQLGRATAERYHAALLRRPDTVAFAAICQARVVGFCFAGTGASPEGQFLRDNLSFIAGEIVRRPWLLARPFIRDRIRVGLGFLRSRMPRVESSRQSRHEEALTIFYLAVAPEHQRRGMAKALLNHVENYARSAGHRRLELSVYLDNRRAIQFYENTGWHRAPLTGEWRGFMEKTLSVPVNCGPDGIFTSSLARERFPQV